MTKVSFCFPPPPHPLSINADVDVPQSISLAAAPLESHVCWVSLTLRHPETRRLPLMCDVRTAENGKRNPHPMSGFVVVATAAVFSQRPVHPFLTFPLASSACPGTLNILSPSLQGSPSSAAFPSFSRCLMALPLQPGHSHFLPLFQEKPRLFVFPFVPPLTQP